MQADRVGCVWLQPDGRVKELHLTLCGGNILTAPLPPFIQLREQMIRLQISAKRDVIMVTFPKMA